MKLPEYSNARVRLGVLFSLPLAFSLLFFAVDMGSQHNESMIQDLQLLHSQIGALRGIANDAEVGENGFLLTGDQNYLATLEAANTRLGLIKRESGDLQTPVRMRPMIARLQVLVEERVREANRVIEIQRDQGLAAAVAFAHEGPASVLMDNIRQEVSSLQTGIDKIVDRHRTYDHRLTNWTFFFFISGTAVTMLVMLWLYRSFLSYIHARDAAHLELRALNTDLERRIEMRTRELQQFNEELQQFAYVASHDLQEPLRTVTSFAQLLATRYRGKLDEDADEFIGYIVNSARRMTDLINGLLALTRLRKSGQSAVAVRFETLVEEAMISLQAAIRDNQAEIEVGALPCLIVDRVQFAQVFQNLISNAIKYRSEAAPAIRIDGIHDTSHWIVSVADNGCGFDQQFAERIFGLFQRLHGHQIDGTGMGLSIAQRIVARHGGHMWAESKEGVGSTFFIRLPTSLESRAAEQPESAPVQQSHSG
jgi:signal transduction histidine kinase